MYCASTKEGTPLKILTGLVFAFLPFAVLAQDGSTGPADRHEDHLVAMQASNPPQGIQPTHEEADAALNGDHILGAAAEPTVETQTVNFSTSSPGELKVDDAIAQVSTPPQSTQPTREEADAALNGDHILGAAAEPTVETQTVNFSTSSADELKVDDAIEQASIPPQDSQSTHEEADAALKAAEPVGEAQTVNLSTSSAAELKVDDAIEQATTPPQSTQPTHEEADPALNGDHILGAAAEPTVETQTVNFSTSSAGELKVDDAIEQVSIPPQNSQSTHEEGAALGGVAELTGENNNAIASTNGYGP